MTALVRLAGLMLVLTLVASACTGAQPTQEGSAAAPSPAPSLHDDRDASVSPSEDGPGPDHEPGPTGEAAAAALAEGVDVVRIEPGDDAEAIAEAHPPGTTYIIGAGLHRGFVAVAEDGDRFLGEVGAVLNGAVVLDGWEPETRDGRTVWEREGLGLEEEYRGLMDEGHEREGLRHDLYVDGGVMRHVPSVDDVGAGSWFYDFDADRMVLGDDPAGRTVELGMAYEAFYGIGSRDVLIADVEVRHYAAPAQFGAINAELTESWTIERVHVEANHGAGVRIAHGTHVLDSVILGNGQIGIAGGLEDVGERPVRIAGNLIRLNGRLGFTWFWERGGMKLVGTTGGEVVDNEVSSNWGVGVWFDVENTDGVVRGNHIRNNSIMGILFELSDGVLIEHNLIERNGWDAGPLLAAGVSVSNSGHVVVRDNVLRRNGNEYWVVHADRTSMGWPPLGMRFEDNEVLIDGGFVGVSIVSDRTDLYDPDVMHFSGNRYQLDRCEPCFFWDTEITTERWRELGVDLDSSFEVVG